MAYSMGRSTGHINSPRSERYTGEDEPTKNIRVREEREIKKLVSYITKKDLYDTVDKIVKNPGEVRQNYNMDIDRNYIDDAADILEREITSGLTKEDKDLFDKKSHGPVIKTYYKLIKAIDKDRADAGITPTIESLLYGTSIESNIGGRKTRRRGKKSKSRKSKSRKSKSRKSKSRKSRRRH